MLDRIAIVQRNNDPKGIQEQACMWLAIAGEQAGFDVLGIHREHFAQEWLDVSNIIIIVDLTCLHRSQTNGLFSVIYGKKKPYVKIIMSIAELEKDGIDMKLYEQSKKNYFCSPEIYRSALKLKIDGSLTFLAGMIDNSWENIASPNLDEQARKARIQFWREIDNMLIN